jgi:lipoprotein-anchoring transpeptidase ErfK/SrfK
MKHRLVMLMSWGMVGLSCTGAIASPADLLKQPGSVIEIPNISLPQAIVSPTTDPANSSDIPGKETQTRRLEIQLSRHRVVMYEGEKMVKAYPIAIGRPGWETPKGKFKVLQKLRNPNWIHPLKKGVVIPGGDPENPLGRFWIGFWTNGKNWIGFHGTPNPESVGKPASHGCIRMYNKDIEDLFSKVDVGTPVTVVQ